MCAVLLRSGIAAEDLLLADFEGKDYGAWQTTGEAFGPAPAPALPRRRQVVQHLAPFWPEFLAHAEAPASAAGPLHPRCRAVAGTGACLYKRPLVPAAP